MKLRHALVVCSLIGGLSGGSMVANAQGTMPEWVAGNSTYLMTLQVGPAEDMVTQDQAAAGMAGEVLANPGPNGMALSMPAATALVNQVMAPNHHIAVQIDRRGTLNPATNISPSILLMNQGTGDAQRFDNVPAMFDANLGSSDYHYGVNAFIPDGTYTISVLVDNQKISFQNVSIAGGGAAMAPQIITVPAPAVSAVAPTGAVITTAASTTLQTLGQQTTTAQNSISDTFANLAAQR